jgi:hypothetical protein
MCEEENSPKSESEVDEVMNINTFPTSSRTRHQWFANVSLITHPRLHVLLFGSMLLLTDEEEKQSEVTIMALRASSGILMNVENSWSGCGK